MFVPISTGDRIFIVLTISIAAMQRIHEVWPSRDDSRFRLRRRWSCEPWIHCYGPKKNIFIPSAYPSCPYATAVGATQLPVGGKTGDAAVAVTRFSSGGGFSNVNPAPDYQKTAVAR